MAAWFIPALKAVLPHIGTIISATGPAFTKKAEASSEHSLLLQQQIGELQAAASQNAAHIKELAAQLQKTISAIEEGTVHAKSAQQRALQFSLVALALSAISICFIVVRVIAL